MQLPLGYYVGKVSPFIDNINTLYCMSIRFFPLRVGLTILYYVKILISKRICKVISIGGHEIFHTRTYTL